MRLIAKVIRISHAKFCCNSTRYSRLRESHFSGTHFSTEHNIPVPGAVCACCPVDLPSLFLFGSVQYSRLSWLPVSY